MLTKIYLINHLPNHKYTGRQNQPVINAYAVRLQSQAHIESQTCRGDGEHDEHGSGTDERGGTVHGGSL